MATIDSVLRSGINKRYRKAFVLDEDGLRRIVGELEQAVREIGTSLRVIFHVEREDERFYETTEIGDVLLDPNVPGKRIESVSLQLVEQGRDRDASGGMPVRILFDAHQNLSPLFNTYGVNLRISHQDRNWSLLLVDRLEPQIMRTFRTTRTPRWIFLLYLVPIAMLGLNPGLTDPTPKAVAVAGLVLATISLVLMLARIFSAGSAWLGRLLGPEAVFLWGDEEHAYAEREHFRRSLLWVVLVGFLISFLATGIWGLITRGWIP